ADIVVIAANTPVDTPRFIGKRVYLATISDCTADTVAFLTSAISDASELRSNQSSQVNRLEPESGVAVAIPVAEKVAKNIVAITACPTGVAHTFMAAEALEKESARLGHSIKVETRGSVGAKNQLTAQDIEQADLVIIAADIEVPLDRFNGKALYKTSTSLALKKTEQEINKAFSDATPYQHSGGANPST
ncbi:fructose PTS transporter subunit IIB, partial [Vibrio genomosp. F10]|uniref:fructose PTS transporter subunit IIB n=1 Tax=Vibrio genomosp. F10 TaxID=723171 RepID=UPI001F5186E8